MGRGLVGVMATATSTGNNSVMTFSSKGAFFQTAVSQRQECRACVKGLMGAEATSSLYQAESSSGVVVKPSLTSERSLAAARSLNCAVSGTGSDAAGNSAS